MNTQKKLQIRNKRKLRIRSRIRGTAERPRLTLHLSNKHLYAQLINDDTGTTLCAVNSLMAAPKEAGLKANLAGATSLGTMIAKSALEKGMSKVVFDRNGRLYHGCVKAFADAARGGGLQF